MTKIFRCKSNSNLLFTYLFVHLVFAHQISWAQPVELGPSIGLESLPSNSAEICDIPFYPLITDELEGLTEGDLIPDFTLYTVDGVEVTASELLSDGKPALFVGGSYTCWVFRDQLPVVNLLQALYGDELHIYIIYTVEAHPLYDISPYFGVELTGDPNFTDDILYEQPDTYGQRKDIVNDMIEDLTISVPVLIDGPCNEWWLNFGTNPNCAYLVQSDGVIYDAEPWLDRFPDDIFASVEGLFGITTDGEPVPDGIVTASAESECITGESGETIVVSGSVVNEDTADAYLDVLRLEENLPEGWLTSICTDICFPPEVMEATMYVDSEETLPMHVYFYTIGADAYGTATILIKNHYIPSNNFTYIFKACTGSTGTADISIERPELFLFPNPATDEVQLQTYSATTSDLLITIFDITGNVMFNKSQALVSGQFNVSVNVGNFASGLYIVKMQRADTEIYSEIIVH
ncbi:MAG: T9SS type A sorting domain-containing protein [Chitinophagales bacterium]